MTLTLDFKETVKDRVERDPAFREELLKEGIECLLTGDFGEKKPAFGLPSYAHPGRFSTAEPERFPGPGHGPGGCAECILG